jgi:uncharacterized cupredoxin-like copper-binding protein
MNRLRHGRIATIALVMLVLVTACTGGAAEEASSPAAITFTATSKALVGPATGSAGYATLTFTNRTDSLMAHGIVRIKDGVSSDSGLRAVRIFHGIERGDPRAAMTAFDGFYGGAVFVAPGASKAVGVVLPPGHYVSYADVVGAGRPRVHDGFVTPIEVRRVGIGGVSLTPEYTMRMRDFGFDAPRQVKAGRSRWRVENAGREVHLAFIARVLPGHTYEDAKRALTNPEGAPPVEPDEKMSGVHALSPGVMNDVELDLRPGEYVIVCFIGGHHMMGMVSPLLVTD